MKKILVIGVGSAGLITLCQFCSYLSDEWQIYSVHDPKIPILGVGEATSTNVPYELFKSTNFLMNEDSDYLDSTYKFNVRYTNWRENQFNSNILGGNYALHFDNKMLKDFVFQRLLKRFPKKIKIMEGNISYVKNTDAGVKVAINDNIEIFDYVVDCGGFPKDFSDYNIVNLPLNSAIVIRKNKPGTWTYTHHWAHKNGWMFGIPLKSKQGWGYMYNDTITSKDDAINDLCSILKLDKKEIEPSNYSFKSYYAKNNLIDGRILKNGNRFMFFEPMEALSIETYCSLNHLYIQYLNKEISKKKLLDRIEFQAESLILFYNFVYHGGSIYDTKFWRKAKKDSTEHVKKSYIFKDSLNMVKEKKMRGINDIEISCYSSICPFPVYTWEKMSENLGYDYFNFNKKLNVSKKLIQYN